MDRIILTGAASGIGRAVAEQLASTGNKRLLLVDRNRDALAQLVAELSERCTAEQVSGDVSSPTFPQEVVERCVSLWGGVDGIVSNAGILKGALLAELTVPDFDLLFAINTRPTWLLGKAAYPYLKASRGAIVATASLAAGHPTPPLGSYAASKAALVMLVKQMALEWGPDGIRCNTVSPGPTATPLNPGYADPAIRGARERAIPLRRVGTAEDVASAIVFLLGESASQISGQDLVVDGGLGIALMALSGSGTGQPQRG